MANTGSPEPNGEAFSARSEPPVRALKEYIRHKGYGRDDLHKILNDLILKDQSLHTINKIMQQIQEETIPQAFKPYLAFADDEGNVHFCPPPAESTREEWKPVTELVLLPLKCSCFKADYSCLVQTAVNTYLVAYTWQHTSQSTLFYSVQDISKPGTARNFMARDGMNWRVWELASSTREYKFLTCLLDSARYPRELSDKISRGDSTPVRYGVPMHERHFHTFIVTALRNGPNSTQMLDTMGELTPVRYDMGDAHSIYEGNTITRVAEPDIVVERRRVVDVTSSPVTRVADAEEAPPPRAVRRRMTATDEVW